MSETLVRQLASLLRSLPDFRGKYRIGMTAEKLLLKGRWNQHDLLVEMKNGHKLIIDPRSFMHKAALFTGRYDDDIIKVFSSLFRKDWLVMDIGASIGYYTIPFALHLRKLGGGKVYAFEPLPANFEKLSRHVAINQVSDIVELFDYALSDKEGEIAIHLTEKGDTGNAYISDATWEHTTSTQQAIVKVHQLDQIMNRLAIDRCDFIKMDIEGAEIMVLKGGRDFLTRFRPIIFGEFNSLFIENFGFNFLDVHKELSALNYIAYVQHNDHFVPVQPAVGVVDVLFVPEEKVSEYSNSGLLKS